MNKTKIHIHLWVDSVNYTCPFCASDMQLCSHPGCYLYRCKNENCRQVVKIKEE